MQHQAHQSSFFVLKKSTLRRLEATPGELTGAAWLAAHDAGLDLDNPDHHDRIAQILSNNVAWGVPAGCRYYIQVDALEEVLTAVTLDALSLLVRAEDEADEEIALAEAAANPLGFALAALEARGGGVNGRKKLALDLGITDRQLRNRLAQAQKQLHSTQAPLLF